MGILGQAISQVLPNILDAGTGWATAVNAYATELGQRCSTLIDSASILLTTGGFPHATVTIQAGAADGQGSGTTWTKGTGGTAGYHLGVGATDTVEWAIKLTRFQRLKAVRISGRSVGTAWTGRVWLVDHSAGTRTQLGSTLTSAALTTIEVLPVAGISPTQLAANQHIVVEWTSGAAATRALACEVDFDRVVAT